MRDASGTMTTIGTATVSGLTHSTSTYYWLRARLSGTTATTAQVRLWADGSNEPTSWTLSSTDSSTPTNLRGSGSSGVYFDARRALHGYFDDLTLRPIDSTAPTAPTGLSGTPVAAGRIDLSWTPSSDNVAVAGYNVYRDSVKVNTAPIGSSSYSDTGLVGGANHTYTVKAIDAAANESTASGTWSGAASSGAVTTTYTYDAENRLTQLASGSNVIGTYAYDGAGNRYSKTAAGVTTAYTLDLASSLPQVLTETAGSTVSTYAYAGGPLELDRSGATNWYLTDTLGSVRLVTDATGASPATYAYSAFGSTRASTGTIANEVRFTGERTDTESGLEFLRARTYDPSVGTFLQRDSWGISPTDGQSLDLYLYTQNNPVNAIDPSGHCMRSAVHNIDEPSCAGAHTAPVTTTTKAESTQGYCYAPGPGCPGTGLDVPEVPQLTDPSLLRSGWDPGVLLVGGSALACVFGRGAACLPLAGVGVYTIANIVKNLSRGNFNVFEGWNSQDAALTAGAVTAMGAGPAGWGWALGGGFFVGAGQDVAAQLSKDPNPLHLNLVHAGCSGVTGLLSGGLTKVLADRGKMSGDLEARGVVWDALNTSLGGKLCDTLAP